MFTFIISIVFFFLLSVFIFQKKLKENIFPTILIIIVGTISTITIVGASFAKNVQYKTTLVKTKALQIKTSNITDSIKIKGYIYVDSIRFKEVHLNGTHFESKSRVNKLTFKYIENKDTIPRFEKYKDIPSINSKWIKARNFPKENTKYIIYLPNDTIHYMLVGIALDIIKSYNYED